MRRALPLTLVGLLALLAAVVVVGGAGSAAGSASPHAPPFTLDLAPAPGDVSLAEVHFRPASARQIRLDQLHVAVTGPFGADYLAVAIPRGHSAHDAWALILTVNRPSGLEDPAVVKLSVTAPRALGAHTVLRVNDLFSRVATGRRPALCDLSRHDAALTASELRELQVRGSSPEHLSAAAAVAQAFDVACGHADEPAFRHELVELPSPPGTTETTSTPTTTTPTSTTPTPAPAPPKVPGCLPCPPVGACPDDVRPAICVEQRLSAGGGEKLAPASRTAAAGG